MSSTILSGCFRFDQQLVVDSQNNTASMQVDFALDMTLVKFVEGLDQENTSSDWEKALDEFMAGNETNPLDDTFSQFSYIKNYRSWHYIDKRTGYLTLSAKFDITNVEQFFEKNMPNHSIELIGNRVVYEANINEILGTNDNVADMRQGNQEEDWGWLFALFFDNGWYAISVETPKPIISTSGNMISTTETEYFVTIGEMITEREFDPFIVEWYR